MNLKLSDWASIAEIVSGIAVVVTLIFLVIGLRENTDVMRASAYDRNLQSLVDWRASILQDPDSVRVFDSFYMQSDGDTSALSSEDRARLRLISGALWVTHEKSFFAREDGLLGDSEWRRFTTNMCRVYAIDAEYWAENMPRFLSEEFATYVVDTCDGSQH